MNKLFLLADDDRDDAELFGEALSSIDPPVAFEHVPDGQAVFQVLSNQSLQKPDVIFLDLNMPEMSGWQCLAKLKNDMYYSDIPVIMYSTSTNPRDREIAVELGAVGFVTKPTDFKLLRRILSEIAKSSKENLKNALRLSPMRL
ncbi:MAG TPA: response regulator [Chryseosolibacter sp.]